ncbi:hypothetical protein KSP40_PGU000094 [Platanthera guangdongensis]|uniref:Uncharacterized protein n=1 Tax=Platanthera guangdongensis TaxID=2320717 RepID=A0ABR2M1M7_9ASPA
MEATKALGVEDGVVVSSLQRISPVYNQRRDHGGLPLNNYRRPPSAARWRPRPPPPAGCSRRRPRPPTPPAAAARRLICWSATVRSLLDIRRRPIYR